MNSRSGILSVAIGSLLLGACAASPPSIPVDIYHLRVSFAEAYLLKGADERLVLIDTGLPGSGEALEAEIEKAGLAPENLSLVVVTHGHGDHAGNARFLQSKYNVPVLGGSGDLDKFTRGMTDLAKAESIGEWGEIFRPVSDLSYEPFTPDITIGNDESFDMSKYGIGATIRGLAGHTPGELVIRVGEHLFVGDALGGSFEAQGEAEGPIPNLVPTGHAIEWVFAEDRTMARRRYLDLETMMDGVEQVYPAHFGPIAAAEVKKFIAANRAP